MAVLVGRKAPHFKAKAIVNGGEEKSDFSLDQYLGKKKVLFFFYPKDFTFICPTEIAGMDALVDEANVIGISGDNEFCKLAWKKENELIGNINYSWI